MNRDILIDAQNVGKTYDSGRTGLREVNFSVATGEFIVVLGPAASGKTTLLRLMAGLDRATEGHLAAPASVGMVFQAGGLFPWLSVADNLALALAATPLTPSQSKRKARLSMERLGVQQIASVSAARLSVEQRQRVSLARALVNDPQLIVMDQPLGDLDLVAVAKMHDELIEIATETKKTIVMTSQSVEEAVTLADRIVLMNAGRIVRVYDLADMERTRRQQPDNFAFQVEAIRRDFLALGE